jgi:hypothetical protein
MAQGAQVKSIGLARRVDQCMRGQNPAEARQFLTGPEQDTAPVDFMAARAKRSDRGSHGLQRQPTRRFNRLPNERPGLG